MKSFSKFLAEGNVRALTHLTHIEEAILHLGFSGARESIEILRSLRDTLQGSSKAPSNVSEKFDGAPAVIFGIDPEDGQFFVGTKGVFSKSKKLVKTKEDLDRWYQGELRSKLETSLEHFPKLGVDGVVQGDLMFTSGDLKNETIDGKKYITFTPNTITYAVPADSELASDIRRAKIGIVLHTSYIGTGSLENLTATPGQIDISNLNTTPDVWYDDPYVQDLSGTVTLTAEETKEVTRYLSGAGKAFQLLSRKDVDLLFETFEELPKSAVGIKIDTFLNQLVRNNRLPEPGQGRKIASEYKKYMKSYWEERVVGSVKTQSNKEKKREFFSDWISRVDFSVIARVIDFMAFIVKAKEILLDKMSQGADSMQTFVWTGDGYRVTSGEGFVVSDKVSGNTWKLVDRLEFSRLNFSGTSSQFGRRS